MKKNKGFALIELLIVLALRGIVISVIFSPIANLFKTFGVMPDIFVFVDGTSSGIKGCASIVGEGGSIVLGGLNLDNSNVKINLTNIYFDGPLTI